MSKLHHRLSLFVVFTGIIFFNTCLFAGWQAGLKAGYISDAWDTSSYPTATEAQLGPHTGATQSQPPWADNRTWVYTGQIYLNGSTYHFAESIDNNTMLILNGTTYINDIDHTTPTTSGAITLSAGWYDIEIRFGNGTGGAGPNSINGWTTTKGFGYKIGGAVSIDGDDYTFPWDDGNMSFFRYDDGAAGIFNQFATDVTTTDAVLNGSLLTTNVINQVTVYWGITNGGTSATSWSNHADFPYPAVAGDFSTNITLTAADTLTFYRFYASNSTFIAWADDAVAVLSGDVTAQVIDSTATEGTGDTGTFRVSRPSTATNGALIVYFTLGGTAANNVDYIGVANSVVIPEGETTADVVIDPIEDLDWNEGSESVTFTLVAGNYIIGTASAISLILDDSASPDQWAHSIPVVFTEYRGSALADFSVLVELGTNISGFSYSDLLSGNYGDLRFTDGTTTKFLHYEIESWDTNGLSQVWVKIPSLAYNTVIWARWGRSGMMVPAYTTNGSTWANNYVAVYHLAEDSGPVKDSSSFANGLSVNNGIQQGTTGMSGSAARWPDGVNDWMQGPASPSIQGMGKLTLQTWFYDEQNDEAPRGLISKRVASGSEMSYYFFKYKNQHIYFYIGGVGGDFANTATGANQWYFTAATYNNTLASERMKVYIDGEFRSSLNATDIVVPVYDSNLFLGILNANYGNSWKGKMDEVRISNTDRSSEWLWAEYMNMASNSVFQAWPGATPSLLIDGYPQKYGVPAPAYGTTNLVGGDIFTCTVPAIVDIDPTSRYACSGYVLYTNMVDQIATSTGNSCVYTNSSGADRLVWQWTKQYYVTFTNSGPGTVSIEGGWYDEGSYADSAALTQSGNQFVGWDDAENPVFDKRAAASISVSVTKSFTLTANFIPALNLSGWSRRLSIKFAGYDGSETLTNFPAMVVFTNNLAGHFRYADMGSPADAGDLRFTAGDGTELFYDIEKWDTNGTSTVWVRLPELSIDNNRIYAHWRNSSEIDPPVYTENGMTWANGYAAVYHMAGESGAVEDSGPAGNGLTIYNDVRQGTNGVAGPATGWPADGNNWLQRPANESLDGMDELTLQAWIYDAKNDTQPRGLISKRVDSGTKKSYYFFKQLNRNLFFYVGNAGGEFSGTATGANQWYFTAATYDRNLASNRMKVYIDGAFKKGRNDATGSVPSYDSALHLGNLNANYNFGGIISCWQGKMDEVRISRKARSADWLRAEYMNMSSHATFLDYHMSFTGTMILFR
ncbi:MAG: DUF2341 domain-containing protein [Kiritimatiellae bacterium]|nr:DUF2341 domain-containing protein [Kiritimatiellia bacterium]